MGAYHRVGYAVHPSRISLIAVLFPSLLTACGMKAAPVPREAVVPLPVEEVTCAATGEGITIEWTLPALSLDGSALREIAGYRVVREGPDGKAVRKEVWFPISERRNRVGEKASFVDAPPQQNGSYVYRVMPFDAYGSSPRQGKGVSVNWEVPVQ